MRGSVYGIATSPRIQVVTYGHTNASHHIHGLRRHLCFCSQDLLYHLTKRRNGLHGKRLHLFRVGAFATAAYGQPIHLRCSFNVPASTCTTTIGRHRLCLLADFIVVVECVAITNSPRDIWVRASVLLLHPQYAGTQRRWSPRNPLPPRSRVYLAQKAYSSLCLQHFEQVSGPQKNRARYLHSMYQVRLSMLRVIKSPQHLQE